MGRHKKPDETILESSLRKRDLRKKYKKTYQCTCGCGKEFATKATVNKHLKGEGPIPVQVAYSLSHPIPPSLHPTFLSRQPALHHVNEPYDAIQVSHPLIDDESIPNVIEENHFDDVWNGGLHRIDDEGESVCSEKEDEEPPGEDLYDILDEDKDIGAASRVVNGTYPSVTQLNAWDTLNGPFMEKLTQGISQLQEGDLENVCGFNYKLHFNCKDSAYEALPHAFPSLGQLTTLSQLRTRITQLSGIKAQQFDCCLNSCLCYIGPHAGLSECPYCREPRYRTDGNPQKQFHYLPVIDRLLAQYWDPDRAHTFRTYRANHSHSQNEYSDIFDGKLYQLLRKRFIKHNGSMLAPLRTFFADDRDIALGLSTDGFGPFKRRNVTCWPLIVFNYNIPPEDRFKKENIISLGVIPGPRQVKDMDSFLYPFVLEMQRLEKGVKAFDSSQGEHFVLHAFVLLCFGDIPAVSKLMRMTGVNGYRPCRMCSIHGIRIPDSSNRSHYVPLRRPGNESYDPFNLPTRSHNEIMLQATKVAEAKTQAEAKRLSTEYGIKGIPILSKLSSIVLPLSFPADFMHVVWENVVKTLVALWTGDHKGLNEGTEEYVLPKTVWEAIAKGTTSSGATMPSSYGCRVPNVLEDRWQFTAEAWSIWTMMYAPTLLLCRFKKPRYYKHFVQLVRLLSICLKLTITEADVNEIERGFASWVNEYERIYYQDNLQRLPVCTLPVHYLLHIAESIRNCGPPSGYWSFPTERHCGSLLPAVHSKKHPFRSLDRRVLELAQLSQLKCIYHTQLGERLDLRAGSQAMRLKSRQVECYPDIILGYPHTQRTLSNLLRRKIIALLKPELRLSDDVLASVVPMEIECWGRLGIVGGDMIHARELITQENHRDMTFIKYARSASSRSQELVHVECAFGRLEHVFVIGHLPSTPANHNTGSERILAVVKPCATIRRRGVIDRVFTKSNDFKAEVVIDVRQIFGVAGRILDPERNEETFSERPGSFAYLRFDLDDAH